MEYKYTEERLKEMAKILVTLISMKLMLAAMQKDASSFNVDELSDEVLKTMKPFASK